MCLWIPTLFLFSDIWSHQLPWLEFYIFFHEKKFYSLNFHVIDIRHRFQCNRLLYYLEEWLFYLIRRLRHSTVILRKYFKNIPLKFCNIARIFIKLLERFLKYCRNLAMSIRNIINGILLQYSYFIVILL